MTLKMVAIGILALMGLSSVMSPKTFRVFLGGFGALCMALFWGLVVMGNHGPEEDRAKPFVIAKIQEVLGLQRTWMESVKSKSDFIVTEFNEGRLGDPKLKEDYAPNPEDDLRQPGSISVPSSFVDRERWSKPIVMNGPQGVSREEVIDGIRDRIKEYLEKLRTRKQVAVGVSQLTPRDLDPTDIQWVGILRKNGSQEVALYFSEKYDEYIRNRGRQVLMKERLKHLVYVVGAVIAALFLTYGCLKILNRRSEPLHDRDYLRHSDISMV